MKLVVETSEIGIKGRTEFQEDFQVRNTGCQERFIKKDSRGVRMNRKEETQQEEIDLMYVCMYVPRSEGGETRSVSFKRAWKWNGISATSSDGTGGRAKTSNERGRTCTLLPGDSKA